eukprot:PhM_4_TR16139/c3_g1_i10/m.88079
MAHTHVCERHANNAVGAQSVAESKREIDEMPSTETLWAQLLVEARHVHTLAVAVDKLCEVQTRDTENVVRVDGVPQLGVGHRVLHVTVAVRIQQTLARRRDLLAAPQLVQRQPRRDALLKVVVCGVVLVHAGVLQREQKESVLGVGVADEHTHVADTVATNGLQGVQLHRRRAPDGCEHHDAARLRGVPTLRLLNGDCVGEAEGFLNWDRREVARELVDVAVSGHLGVALGCVAGVGLREEVVRRALEDRVVEEPFLDEGRGAEVRQHGHPAGALTEDRHIASVATEVTNVLVDPTQCLALVQQPAVGREAGHVEPTEHTQAVVDGDDDNAALRHLAGLVHVVTAAAVLKPTAVEPHHDRVLALRVWRAHVQHRGGFHCAVVELTSEDLRDHELTQHLEDGQDVWVGRGGNGERLQRNWGPPCCGDLAGGVLRHGSRVSKCAAERRVRDAAEQRRLCVAEVLPRDLAAWELHRALLCEQVLADEQPQCEDSAVCDVDEEQIDNEK